jgi:hypothetical protein
MLIEMLLLILIAAAVFAWVLAPLLVQGRRSETPHEVLDEPVEEQREPVAPDGQPVRDTP